MPTDKRLISETSPAAASTVVGDQVMERLDEFDAGVIVATLTGATGGTLDVYLQHQDPVTGDWFDYLHFAQVAAGAAAATFAVPMSRKHQALASEAVGMNATPALAVDTCVGGDFGSRMRAVFVAGVGTSAGAAQVIRFFGTKLTR